MKYHAIAIVWLILASSVSLPSTALAQSTAAPIDDRFPKFSPDGKSIAFISNRGGGRHIFVITPDGTGLTKLVPAIAPPPGIGSVDWFANGDVLYTTYDETLASGKDNGLSAVRFNRMTSSGADPQIVFQGINIERPSTSPTGNSIVFEAEHGAFGTHPAIDVVLLDIPTLTQRVLTGGDGQYVQAAWSPDGSKIAFACGPKETNDLQICVTSVGGGSLQRLTSGPGSHEWPTWSPDSNRLAFFVATTVNGKIDSRIGVVGINGANQTFLTNHNLVQRDETPSWSPDGNSIVFQTDRLGAGMRIAIMNADGSNVRMLTK